MKSEYDGTAIEWCQTVGEMDATVGLVLHKLGHVLDALGSPRGISAGETRELVSAMEIMIAMRVVFQTELRRHGAGKES